MGKYEDTIKTVQELLGYYQEWESRYAGYIDTILSNPEIIKDARKEFNVPSQFTLHMSVSKATGVTKSVVKFDLRYHGHNIGCLKVNKGTVELEAVKNKDIISAMNKCGVVDEYKDEDKLEGKINWNEASEFRRIYAELEKKIQNNNAKLTKNKEHELESKLLKNFSKKSSDGKLICNIQPVTMLKESLFFQMPTPLKASNAKDGSIEYSAEKGGGIDILARIGHGNTHLAIIELKDKYEKNEPPEKAICQAIAYATFIRELLRRESGEKWWKFFGFSGDIPRSLKLFAIISMPNSENANKDFVYTCNENAINLSLGRDDKLELGYIYLENKRSTQEISKNLPLKSNI